MCPNATGNWGRTTRPKSRLRADVRETLRALLPVLKARRSPAQAQRAAQRIGALRERNWSAQREGARQAAAAAAACDPIAPRFLMMNLVDALPPDAIVVEEALTAAPFLAGLLPMKDANSFYGLASGGLGFAVPGAIGISLAQPGRPVVAAIGDGSAMYGIQALWTAAHLKLPITYVIINNRSYRIIKERLVASRKSDRFVAMDLRIRRSISSGWRKGWGWLRFASPTRQTSSAVLRKAIGSGLPNLIEVIVEDGFGNIDGKAEMPRCCAHRWLDAALSAVRRAA